MNAGAPRTLAHSWLLLIHQLPAKPAYLRVKIWRRLQDLGAIAVKNAVHALPMTEDTQEDFEWLLREIVEGGGEAIVCEARLIDGLSDEEVRALFDRARDADYEEVAREAGAPSGVFRRLVSLTAISRSGSAYGRGLRRTALTTLKIAVFAPTPSARAATATSVNPGRATSVRKPYLMSCSNPSIA